MTVRIPALLFALLLLALALPVFAQTTPVTAEAIGSANLRAAPGTDFDLVGQIVSGTRYPVLGRSEFYPWLLLGDPATGRPIGWVFNELVTVQGDVFAVPISALVVDPSPQTPLPQGEGLNTPSGASQGLFTPSAVFTPLPSGEGTGVRATPTLNAAVTGAAQGEINVRYGPGVEYPRLGVAQAGDVFEVTGWHTQLPWVQIRYAASPNGYGWVQADLLQYTGDRFSLPSISALTFNLPTLTPTPSVLQVVNAAGVSVPLTPAFAALGDQLWNLMLAANFDPQTSRLGTLFLMDLQTGEALAFGTEFAFSGMSINKIAILTEFFGMLDNPPDDAQAFEIAEAMVCSENTSTNDMLSIIGGGSPYTGARAVTTRLQGLGFTNTFIAAPYFPDARITPEPVSLPTSSANQLQTEPDPSNQMTADEVGVLLSEVYQCAVNETGALLATYPDDYTPAECRQIINTMSNNRINALIEMGVPEGTIVAHKHGWVDDTHGDAGIVFTPGGDFALVVAVHNPVWMNFEESFPLVAEITRTVYNYYNPTAPMPAVREGEVSDECNIIGSPLMESLLSSDVALPTPVGVTP
ncbi:MAG: serine hydrolase [Chloroflexota bacterium]|nr:serine hydrolase [Chloroflexota bacterium]